MAAVPDRRVGCWPRRRVRLQRMPENQHCSPRRQIAAEATKTGGHGFGEGTPPRQQRGGGGRSEVGEAGSGGGNLVRSHQAPNRCRRVASTGGPRLRERPPPGLLLPSCRSHRASSPDLASLATDPGGLACQLPETPEARPSLPREDALHRQEALPPPSRWPHGLPRGPLQRRREEERGEGGARGGGAGLRPCRPDGSDAGERELGDSKYSFLLQEDSVKTGKVTAAGMYFLGFPVYRFEQNNLAAAAKDSDGAFFKRLDSFQPCDIHELKPGTHFFAVYGDNFFKSANYTIEVVSGESFPAEKEMLRNVEAKILTKRAELSKFESEYREVLAKFTEMTNKYTEEMQAIDQLLKERNEIHASYTNNPPPPLKRSSSRNKAKSPSKMPKSDADKHHLKEKKVKDHWQSMLDLGPLLPPATGQGHSVGV
ncbi:chaperone protein dnaJ 16 [Panicum miliaceum]|uniref:Chaperone protein dnaJ 16 n=1 Tax=Panicum miliaceum TaxID=4540 RepID=A0A3L6PDS7_PANMI|nr:chaperone protein dnaJ 16 [Panicum miliaceum]